MQQPDNKPNMIVSMYFKKHKFDIITLRDEFLKFHSVTEIKVDDIPIITLMDVYADFDQNNKIDLVSYHSQKPAGWIDMKILIDWKEMKTN